MAEANLYAWMDMRIELLLFGLISACEKFFFIIIILYLYLLFQFPPPSRREPTFSFHGNDYIFSSAELANARLLSWCFLTEMFAPLGLSSLLLFLPPLTNLFQLSCYHRTYYHTQAVKQLLKNDCRLTETCSILVWPRSYDGTVVFSQEKSLYSSEKVVGQQSTQTALEQSG